MQATASARPISTPATRGPRRSIQRPTNGAGRTPASVPIVYAIATVARESLKERGDPVRLAGRGHEGTQRPTRQDDPAIVKRHGPHDTVLRYGLACLGLFRGHTAGWRRSAQIRRGRPTRLGSSQIANGQRTPQRQVRSVVHVERREQQHVRNGHAGDVNREPAAPEPPSRSPANDSGAKRQDAENKEVRVGRPSEDGQSGHR